MELWGNGVMNSLAQISNTPSSNTSLPSHTINRGDTFVLTERDSSIRAGTDLGIYTRDTHSATLFWVLRGEAVLSCRL
jgi:hypothetical protein